MELHPNITVYLKKKKRKKKTWMLGFTVWKQSLCELVSTQMEKTNEIAVLWKTLDKKWHFR